VHLAGDAQIDTITPFGSSGQYSMLLEAPTFAVKQKWLNCLQSRPGEEGKLRELPLVEGLLNKLQVLGAGLNRLRWFVLTRYLCPTRDWTKVCFRAP
jgi:hypothetical protein